LRGFGAHSNDAEYIETDSIEPRLYLLTRMIMDVSQGKDRQAIGAGFSNPMTLGADNMNK
jgi:hypothetical protein